MPFFDAKNRPKKRVSTAFFFGYISIFLKLHEILYLFNTNKLKCRKEFILFNKKKRKRKRGQTKKKEKFIWTLAKQLANLLYYYLFREIVMIECENNTK
jgi:hypothetical protein